MNKANEAAAYLMNCPCWSLNEFRSICETCEPPDPCVLKLLIAALCSGVCVEHTTTNDGEKIKHRWVIEGWQASEVSDD